MPSVILAKDQMPKTWDGVKTVVIQSKPLSSSDLKFAREAKRRGIKVFVDICDNPFAKFSYNPISSAHQLLLMKRLMHIADHLTVPTSVMKGVFEAHGYHSFPISVVPDIAIPAGWERDAQQLFKHFSSEPCGLNDTASCVKTLSIGSARTQYADKFEQRRNSGIPLSVLWFGLAKSKFGLMGLESLQQCLVALESVHSETALELNVVSSDEHLFDKLISRASFPTHYHNWVPGKVHELLERTDVAVLPTSDDPFNRVKSANRMLLALGMGVPVVTPPHPSLEHLGDAVWTGGVAEGVQTLTSDPAKYSQIMQSAQVAVESLYSPKVLADTWCKLADIH